MERIWSKHKQLNTTLKPKVFVAMSGGVDSSVTAALLKKEGYEIVGVHIKCYNLDGCGERDVEDARRAAEHLGIPFYVFDFEQEYKNAVVKYMVNGYKKGITPNPDVMCNKEIKFGLFFKKALAMGADCVATGHYVRRGFRIQNLGYRKNPKQRTRDPKSYILYSARDKNKDQSYFLWTLTQRQLKHCLFPIGEHTKPQVRRLARKFGLHNAEKKDSQGICFLGQVSLPDFLSRYIKPKVGFVVHTETGKIIGEHSGAHLYTVGQRHLGIKYQVSSIKKGNNQKPYYVAAKDIKKNIVYVAEGDSNQALYKKEIKLTNVNFLTSITNNQLPITVYARVRYRQPLAKASLVVKCDKRPGSISLKFDRPVKFVAEGQSAVFYSKTGEMIGGGIIS